MRINRQLYRSTNWRAGVLSVLIHGGVVLGAIWLSQAKPRSDHQPKLRTGAIAVRLAPHEEPNDDQSDTFDWNGGRSQTPIAAETIAAETPPPPLPEVAELQQDSALSFLPTQNTESAPLQHQPASHGKPQLRAAELLPSVASLSGAGNLAGRPAGTQIGSRKDFEAAVLAADPIRNRPRQEKIPPTRVEVFGQRATGGTFVFLLDRSHSMGAEGVAALARAQDEIARTVSSLKAPNRYQVLGYNQSLWKLNGEGLKVATQHARQQTARSLRGMFPNGGTEHFPALMYALKLKPDVIFVLTDGGDPALSIAQQRTISQRNAGHTIIHCLHFVESARPSEDQFLVSLARRNRGQYRQVSFASSVGQARRPMMQRDKSQVRSAFCLLALSILLVVPTTALAQGNHRWVEFRDGSLLRIPLSPTLPYFAADGSSQSNAQPVESIQELYLSPTSAAHEVARMHRLLGKLSSDRFQVREDASQGLRVGGSRFRDLLVSAYQSSKSLEVRHRLLSVLRHVPNSVSCQQYTFDRLQRKGVEGVALVDVRDWSTETVWRTQELTLDRSNVLRVVDQRPSVAWSKTETPKIERLKKDTPVSNVVKVDFDLGPAGEPLEPRQDISKTYVPLGCTFATSLPDTFIALQDYNVDGPSKRYAAAAASPRYQGITTVRFHLPSRPDVAAGVFEVGVYLKYVQPGGTLLEAYDAQARLLGSVDTQSYGADFLGLRSSHPIAYVRIVPVERLDEDYAFDDLFFTTPIALGEVTTAKQWTVLLTNGERIRGRSLAITDEAVTLEPFAELQVDKITLNPREISAIVPPKRTAPPIAAETNWAWATCRDGSRMAIVRDEKVSFLHQKKLDAGEGQFDVISLHRRGDPFTFPQRNAAPLDEDFKGRLLASRGPNRFAWVDDDCEQPNCDVQTLRDNAIAKVIHREKPSAKNGYAPIQAVWWEQPSPRPEHAGLLRQNNGDELVLHNSKSNAGIRCLGFASTGVQLQYNTKKWTVPWAEIRLLSLPTVQADAK